MNMPLIWINIEERIGERKKDQEKEKE